MKRRVVFSFGLVIALGLGSLIAWSQFNDMEASETSPLKSTSVLPASKFFGKSATGYAAAQQCPEIIAKLFCYCGCDMTDKHTTLLDCFTSEHGADCEICTDEALIAAKMKKEGKSVAEIQQAVEDKYSKEYPFEAPSDALKNYREKVLGHAESANSSGDSSNSAPKLKPGAKAGSCCGNHKADK